MIGFQKPKLQKKKKKKHSFKFYNPININVFVYPQSRCELLILERLKCGLSLCFVIVQSKFSDGDTNRVDSAPHSIWNERADCQL